MALVAFHNTSAHVMFVGTVMVPPSEIRYVDERLLPQAHAENVQQETVTDPLAELLKNSVAVVLPALETMSLEELEKLGELEQSGLARKGILGPIAERILKISNDIQGGGTNLNQLEVIEGTTSALGSYDA